MSHQSQLNKLKQLTTLATPVEPRRIEVRRKTDRELIYAVGEGEAHMLLAVESQVDYLRWLSTRLVLSDERTELLLGDARSGTSWAGLTALVSMAAANAVSACVFTNPHLLKDTHRLLRSILPRDWVDRDAEERGFYRLPKRRKLHVVSYKKPETWPEHCEVVMLNDYAYAPEETIEAILRHGTVRVVTGNPPLEKEPGRAWVLRERDRAMAVGMLFRFKSEQNQSLMGDVSQYEQIVDVLAPERKTFWDGTGLENSPRKPSSPPTARALLREYSNPFRRYPEGKSEQVRVAVDGMSALAADLLRNDVGRDEAVPALHGHAERTGVLDKVHMLSHGDALAPVRIPVGATNRQIIEMIANAPE